MSAVDRNPRSEFRLIIRSIHYDAFIFINIAFSFFCYACISITCKMEFLTGCRVLNCRHKAIFGLCRQIIYLKNKIMRLVIKFVISLNELTNALSCQDFLSTDLGQIMGGGKFEMNWNK